MRSQLLCHPWILGHGVEVQCRVSVHGRSMDVPVTVLSMDTRMWGGDTVSVHGRYSVVPVTMLSTNTGDIRWKYWDIRLYAVECAVHGCSVHVPVIRTCSRVSWKFYLQTCLDDMALLAIPV